MKRLTFLSATAIVLTLSFMEASAQSESKLIPNNDSTGIYHRIDSNTYLIDSNKFVRKPNYNNCEPIEMPNAFKSAQSTSKPMPVKKIPLAVPENKKD